MAKPQQYNYTALSPQYIRVLDICAGAADAVLACRVVVQQIDDEPYEALSYVWGDATPVTTIQCLNLNLDGTNTPANKHDYDGEIGVAANLAAALLTFRRPDSCRRIWVNALCVNQADVIERQAQVCLMGDIFRNAQNILCWLGGFDHLEGGESTARLAIDFLRCINSQPEEQLSIAHEQLHFGDDARETDAVILAPWLAIKELFDLQYFHRSWIVQEVGLGRHARLFWGGTDVWVDWDEMVTLARLMDINGASIVNHLQLKCWMADHVDMIWNTDATGEPVHSFVEVLHWARVHQSTDPRDYVYALLSHPTATVNGRLLVQPDYTISHTQAYTDLAVNVVKQTNSLNILLFVDHNADPNFEELPSWVPNWCAVNLVAPLRSPTCAAAEKGKSITITQSENKMVLRCQGFIIDTLRRTSDMIVPNELTIKSLEKEMQKKTPFLIDHIWSKTIAVPGMPSISPQQLINSLSFILTGGYRSNTLASTSHHPEQLKADLMAYILESERIRPANQPSSLLNSFPPEAKLAAQATASTGSASQFIQEMTWNTMCRKVFRTAKGHIGLGPRTMREGDICAVLLGAVLPLVLRPHGYAFLLVGPALLHGFMDGEAQQLASEGVLLEKEILLV